jgi:hypothetical protein
MTIVVENSADQIKAYTENNGVFPVPPDVAADNAAQAAKKEAAKPTDTKVEPTKAVEPTKEIKAGEVDQLDIEGEDGLTPRQKQEFTKSMQKTIAKKHRAQREAEEFATTQYNASKLAEQRAADLAAENATLKAQLKPTAAPTDDAKEPQRADFKTDQEHWDAMVDYRVEKKLRVSDAAREKQADEQRQTEIRQHAAAKIEKAIELVPDFKEVTEAAETIIPDFVVGYMQESEMFTELGYHFAKHPDVVEKLAKFTDGVPTHLRDGRSNPQFVKAVTRQLVELGKIESTLKPFARANDAKDDESAPEASQKNGQSRVEETGSSPSQPRKVAPIIRPLNGGSAAQVDKDEADMGQTEVIKAWQRKHGVTLTARKRH